MNQPNLQWFKKTLQNKDIVSRLKKIKLIITDVDGTMTNGDVLIPRAPQEKELKGISMQDDFGIGKALEKDIHFAIITGRVNHAFKKYAQDLGIPSSLYFEGIDKDKFKKVAALQKKLNLKKEEVMMIGDDYLDFEVKPYVNMLALTCNAPFYIYENADLQMPVSGGQSALRLLIDLVLYVQKKHFTQKLIEELVGE